MQSGRLPRIDHVMWRPVVAPSEPHVSEPLPSGLTLPFVILCGFHSPLDSDCFSLALRLAVVFSLKTTSRIKNITRTLFIIWELFRPKVHNENTFEYTPFDLAEHEP